MKEIIACVAALTLLSISAPSFAQNLTRGPYLQTVTPTSATIVWRTSSPSVGKVWIDGRTFSSPRGTQHEVEVDGLEPSTRYSYRVGSDAPLTPDDEGYYLESAPPVGTEKHFRAWVVGDSGNGSPKQRAVRDAMLEATNGEGPDIYLHMGDMAYNDGTDAEFQKKFFEVYQEVMKNTVTWPTMGNHEGRTSNSATESGPYYEGYSLPRGGEAGGAPSGTEAYYSFDWANVHFVVLDSHESDRRPGGPMLTWLEADLASTDQEWLVAYWHHPAYSKGSHDSDRESQLKQMREYVLPVLEAAGVDLVMAGHSHIYERSYLLRGAYDTPTTAAGHILDPGDGRAEGDGVYDKRPDGERGTVYITAGHGGASIRQKGSHPVMFLTEPSNGSVLLDVEGGVLSARNIRFDGAISDSFTIVKREGALFTWPIGGETLVVDEAYELRWTGTQSRYRLERSSESGWEELAIVEGHRYIWRPARSDRAQRLRVTALDGTPVTSQSRPFDVVADGPRALLPFGATWAFWDHDESPGDTWYSSEFPDRAWRFASGQFGFGDGDENTRITPGRSTYYFRHTFELPATARVSDARLDIVFDDAYEVWVNGQRVGSDGILESMTHDIPGVFESADNEWAREPLEDGLLRPGRNVVAVRIKPAAGTDDMSFDARIMAEVEGMPREAPAIGPSPSSQPAQRRVPPTRAVKTDGCQIASGSQGVPALILLIALPIVRIRRRRRP